MPPHNLRFIGFKFPYCKFDIRNLGKYVKKRLLFSSNFLLGPRIASKNTDVQGNDPPRELHVNQPTSISPVLLKLRSGNPNFEKRSSPSLARIGHQRKVIHSKS